MGPYAGGDYNLTLYPLQSRLQHSSKRIEYKEATLRFGRRRLFIFEVFLGLHRKSEGGRVILDSVYGSHLTCQNLDRFQSD